MPDETPSVIAERTGWIVIAKPAGWHSVGQGSGTGSEGEGEAPTVESWLRAERPEHAGLPEAGIVHRLDLGTSGCLVAARSAAEHERLRAAVGSAGGAKKTYLALVHPGIAEQGSFRLYFSSRHKGSRKVTVRREGEAPECGRCRWTVLRRDVGGGHDLVEVELVGRGRRHQIRAGLAWLGHPLAGDALYGADCGADCGGDGTAGSHEHPALHAWRVEIDGDRVECPAGERFGA